MRELEENRVGLELWQDKGAGPKGPKLLSAHRILWPTLFGGGPWSFAYCEWIQRFKVGPVHGTARDFTARHRL